MYDLYAGMYKLLVLAYFKFIPSVRLAILINYKNFWDSQERVRVCVCVCLSVEIRNGCLTNTKLGA